MASTRIVLLRVAQAHRLWPVYTRALLAWGNAQSSLKKLPEASERFEDAMGLAPTMSAPYELLAQARAEGERLDEAVKLYKHATRLSPDDARVRRAARSAAPPPTLRFGAWAHTKAWSFRPAARDALKRKQT